SSRPHHHRRPRHRRHPQPQKADAMNQRWGADSRHGWNEQVCDLLDATEIGRAAQQILDADTAPRRGPVTIITLPRWRWRNPGTATGRKGTTAGGNVLIPTRIEWDTPSPLLLLEPGTETEIGWQWRHHTDRSRGVTRLQARTGPEPSQDQDPPAE